MIILSQFLALVLTFGAFFLTSYSHFVGKIKTLSIFLGFFFTPAKSFFGLKHKESKNPCSGLNFLLPKTAVFKENQDFKKTNIAASIW